VNIRSVTAALAAVTLTACVSQVPMTLSERFSNPHTRPANAPRLPRNALTCRVIVSTIADTRTNPELLGRVAGRPVRAPADVSLWLRNVVAGLESRGVVPHFDSNPTHEASPLVAGFTLRLAWVSEIHTAKTATILLRMKLTRGGSVLREKDYRGSDTVMNWSSGNGELQNMVDRAFGGALDQIADDVRAACKGQT
jgi:hypothetical protein